MIKIEMSFPEFAKKFKEMQNDLMLLLAATMQANRGMMFDKDGADNDKQSWKPINTMFRSGRPLQNTGTLRKSMAPQNDGLRPGHKDSSIVRIAGNVVAIGTNLLYARMMNDGTTKMPDGVLRPRRAKALKIPVATGAFMFRKSVKIPARPMDIITAADRKEFGETMSNYIAERLNEP